MIVDYTVNHHPLVDHGVMKAAIIIKRLEMHIFFSLEYYASVCMRKLS